MANKLNTDRIKHFFDNEVPNLPFILASESLVKVNVATLNQAEDLAQSFNNFTHPDVIKFLEEVAEIAEGESEADEDIIAITKTRGYLKFIFWLTVYTNNLQAMIELHSINYAKKIGINLDDVKVISYFPHMKESVSNKNPYKPFFGGDINKIMAFVNSLENTFVRMEFEDDYIDISAVNILGYL